MSEVTDVSLRNSMQFKGIVLFGLPWNIGCLTKSQTTKKPTSLSFDLTILKQNNNNLQKTVSGILSFGIFSASEIYCPPVYQSEPRILTSNTVSYCLLMNTSTVLTLALVMNTIIYLKSSIKLLFEAHTKIGTF